MSGINLRLMMYIRLFFYCFGLIVAFMTCQQIRTKNKEIKRCHTLCYVLDVQWLSPSVEELWSPTLLMEPSQLSSAGTQSRREWWMDSETEDWEKSLWSRLHVSPPSHRCVHLSFFSFFLPPGELADSQAYRDITGRMHMLNILEERYLELMQQPWKH